MRHLHAVICSRAQYRTASLLHRAHVLDSTLPAAYQTLQAPTGLGPNWLLSCTVLGAGRRPQRLQTVRACRRHCTALRRGIWCGPVGQCSVRLVAVPLLSQLSRDMQQGCKSVSDHLQAASLELEESQHTTHTIAMTGESCERCSGGWKREILTQPEPTIRSLRDLKTWYSLHQRLQSFSFVPPVSEHGM